MQPNGTIHSVLFAVYDLAARDVSATPERVAHHARVGLCDTERALLLLGRAGLVDEARVRLTMAGLAMAVSMGCPRARRVAAPPSSRRAA